MFDAPSFLTSFLEIGVSFKRERARCRQPAWSKAAVCFVVVPSKVVALFHPHCRGGGGSGGEGGEGGRRREEEGGQGVLYFVGGPFLIAFGYILHLLSYLLSWRCHHFPTFSTSCILFAFISSSSFLCQLLHKMFGDGANCLPIQLEMTRPRVLPNPLPVFVGITLSDWEIVIKSSYANGPSYLCVPGLPICNFRECAAMFVDESRQCFFVFIPLVFLEDRFRAPMDSVRMPSLLSMQTRSVSVHPKNCCLLPNFASPATKQIIP